MKKIILSSILLSAGLTSLPSYAHTQDNLRRCSQFMSVWLPNHPFACPASYTWQEIMPGIDIGISQQAFDWRGRAIYSDITLENNTGEALPANSKIIISDTNLAVLNASGTTEETNLPYFLLDEAIPAGESITLQARFKLRIQRLQFGLDFEYGEVSDGTIEINGLPMVSKTLTTQVNDPDGLSNAISYQWFADGTAIDGAISNSLVLTTDEEGKNITVQASYIDDGNFAEVINSTNTGPVAARPNNVDGRINVSGNRLIGATLTATVNDDNGISETISFQWSFNGEPLNGETQSILSLKDSYVGGQITVSASYTDFHNYEEELTSLATSRIATTSVAGKDALLAAVASANQGDWIALDAGDYDSISLLSIGDEITLTQGQDNNAVISGPTCIVLDGDKSALVGLTFSNLNVDASSTCASNGESAIYMSGDNLEMSENSFLGEAATLNKSPFNWISVKGSYSLISRNLFQGKNLDEKGAAISLYNNLSNGDQKGHVIQYNLFKDFTGGAESSAHALQIGRSTSDSANGEGAHIVRYNRFENIQAKQRLIKVQSSNNQIYNNTFEDSIGNIALENGQANIVANNIILPTGEDADSNDSGVSFTPYGHTITGNYIAGLRTTSSQRGGLLTNSERFGDSGNAILTPSAVTIANNTIMNSRQPINFSATGCVEGTFIINFDSNLIANGEDPTADVDGDYGFEGRSANGEGRDAIIDECTLSASSTHNNEHYYSADLSKNATFVFSQGSGNIGADDTEGFADVVAANYGLLEGNGVDAGIGASTLSLVYLTNADVGPGSDFIGSAPQTTYDKPVELDLSRWNITFPDGSSEKNPQWLMDGNTRADEFFYGDDGSMTFKTPNVAGTTTNSSFSRTELRGMLRGPDQDPEPSDWPDQTGFTKNNWVFSSSDQATEFRMGGVDGTMSATLRVDHVDNEGDASQVGRVIIGQIHASDDEPLKLYYRKLPGNELGSIYFNQEIPLVNITEYHDMIGGHNSNDPNPVDGVALGEIFSYDIIAKGDKLTVNIHREGKPSLSKTIDINPGYANDWLYFKAGVYNQNNTGLNGYAQATFFALTHSHDAPPTDPGIDIGDGGIGEGDPDGAIALQTAINNASAGDVIELTDGNYANLGLIAIGTEGVTLTRAAGSTAVISGETCLYVSASNVRITGLVFENFAMAGGSACQSNGEAVVSANGNNFTFDNNTMNGDALLAVPSGEDTFNWLALKKSDAIVERNTFQNKRGLQTDLSPLKGGFISVYITGSGSNNTIQYNLFKDMTLSDESSAYGVQIGRSTGADAADDGFNVVQYNRFDNVDSKSRVIKVQGGNNTIHGNTIVNSQGMIALEDGQANVVTNNVILPSGSDSNDGGISFAPYGHTIMNNYIAGSKTTSSERAALMLNWSATGSGNALLTPSAVLVSGNTVVNAKQPILFATKSCLTNTAAFTVDMDNNLIANGVSGVASLEGTTVTGVAAIHDECAIDLASTIDGNIYYTATESNNGFLSSTYGSGNITGTEADSATNLSAASNGLVVGSNGADADALIIIEETDVGAGSITAF